MIALCVVTPALTLTLARCNQVKKQLVLTFLVRVCNAPKKQDGERNLRRKILIFVLFLRQIAEMALMGATHVIRTVVF